MPRQVLLEECISRIWDGDNLLDILISTEDKGPILLHNITSSPSNPEFQVASVLEPEPGPVFPEYAQGVLTFGAGVGDFDQDGRDDFILLLFEPENSPPRIPVIMENDYPLEFIKHDIQWLKDPDPNPYATNQYRDTYRVLDNRRSYEAAVLELENHADTIIVAAELPYYLIKDFWPPTSPFKFHEWTLEGLKFWYNTLDGDDCTAHFTEGASLLGEGIAFRAVALIEYDERLPDIIAADADTIYIARNNGSGGFSLEAPGESFTVVLNREGTEDTDLGITRLVPINYDNRPPGVKDDFFVAVQGGDNVILQALPREAGEPRSFVDPPISMNDNSWTWGAAVFDFDFYGNGGNDGYDDVITFNEWAPEGHTRVYQNNCVGQIEPGGPIFIEVTGDFFLASRNDPTNPSDPYEYWEYNVLPGNRNPDYPLDGIIVDLFEAGTPQIVLGCDGQNRLLLHEDLKAMYSGVRGVPPPPEGIAGSVQGWQGDFLMMSGLTGLLSPELAVLFDPNWLPALPQVLGLVE